MKTGKLLIIFLMLFSHTIAAQVAQTKQDAYDKKIIPIPPNAAAFKIYGDIPVGHTSGVPDISIPIYEINVNGCKIPIILRYHLQSAQKVRGVISNVALGWNLDFGGMITQSVNDLPDNGTKIENENVSQEDIEKKVKDPSTGYDYQYDNFSYSFFCNTGEYLYTPDKVIPYSQLGKKPINILESSTEHAIIDDKGVKYYFGGTGFDDTDYPAEGIIPSSVTHWIRKIEFPSGKTINYTYSQFNDKNLTSKPLYNNKSTLKAILKYYGGGYNDAQPYQPANYTAWNSDVEAEFHSENINGVIASTGGYSDPYAHDEIFIIENQKRSDIISSDYAKMLLPKTMTFPGGSIEFISGSDSLISKVIVMDNSSRIIKQIRFVTSNEGSIGCQKLLASVIVEDTIIPTISEVYSLDYYEKTPGIGYDQSDFWGLYNGSSTSVPYTNLGYFKVHDYTYGITDRNLVFNSGGQYQTGNSSSCILANALKSITYPTGGSTELIYEQNQYNGPHVSISGGGIRVRQIINTDNVTGLIQKKTYEYKGVEDNCVDLTNPAHYIQSQIGLDHIMRNGFSDYYLTINFTATKMVNLPVDISVKYNLVREYNGDSNNNEGFTDYQYSFLNNHVYDFYESDFMNYSSEFLNNNFRDFRRWYIKEYRNWDNGLLVKKSIYKKGDTVPMQEIRYDYAYILEDSLNNYYPIVVCSHPGEKQFETAEQLKWNNQNYGGAFGFASYPVTIPQPYAIYKTVVKTGHSELRKVTDVQRYGSSEITKETNYSYNAAFPYYPATETTTASSGVASTITKKYPFDFNFEPYISMVNKNMLNFEVEENITVGDMQKNSKTDYYKWSENIIKPMTISQSQSQVSNPTSLEPRVSILKYDNYGNPVAIKNEQNLYTVYLWSYGGQYLVAELKNTTYDQAELALDLTNYSDINALATDINPDIEALRTKLNEYFYTPKYKGPNNGSILITTYAYKPLFGMISMTDPREISTYYDYDTFGRLKDIYQKNANDVIQILQSYDYHYKK